MPAITPTYSTVMDAQVLTAQLEQAVAWANLQRGRTTRYAQLIREFFAGQGTSPEHVLAFFEAMEVAEIYELWHSRVNEYPGLFDKIHEVLASGPLLRESEHLPAASNRARDDAFSLLMGGRLVATNSDVLAVEGINRKDVQASWVGDVTIQADGTVLDLQCKRPQDALSIERNISRAKRQILNAPAPKAGIIAIDLSVVLRPSGTVLAARGVSGASEKLSALVDTQHEAVNDALVAPEIAGIIWSARIPCMVHDQGIVRPYCAGELAIALNTASPHMPRLTAIGHQVNRWLEFRNSTRR